MFEQNYISRALEALSLLQREEIQDINSFILRNPYKWSPEDLRILADQWNFKKKSKGKLGPWELSFPQLIGPPKLSWEQASSYWTAQWKSRLVQSNETLLDMTGGWGMDALFFAQRGTIVTHCELQPLLSEIISHNAHHIGVPITTYTGSSFDLLDQTQAHWDVLYIDPARRDSQQKKVVQLADLTPDLTHQWEKLLQHTNRILVKLSPMMDLAEIRQQIPHINTLTLLSVRNELKEILVDIRAKQPDRIQWQTIDFPTDGEPIHFTFFPEKEDRTVTSYAEPRQYLYEPLVGILKLGAFHHIGTEWHLEKLHPNSHLYTSDTYMENFPGRIFEVRDLLKAKPEEAFKTLGKPIPANVLVRNYGENGEAIVKKWNLKARDSIQFLIFTQTILHKKRVIYAHRLK